jgi:hypothetical protein
LPSGGGNGVHSPSADMAGFSFSAQSCCAEAEVRSGPVFRFQFQYALGICLRWLRSQGASGRRRSCCRMSSQATTPVILSSLAYDSRTLEHEPLTSAPGHTADPHLCRDQRLTQDCAGTGPHLRRDWPTSAPRLAILNVSTGTRTAGPNLR